MTRPATLGTHPGPNLFPTKPGAWYFRSLEWPAQGRRSVIYPTNPNRSDS